MNITELNDYEFHKFIKNVCTHLKILETSCKTLIKQNEEQQTTAKLLLERIKQDRNSC